MIFGCANDEQFIRECYEARFERFEYLDKLDRSVLQRVEYAQLGDWIYENPDILKHYRNWKNGK